MARDGQMRMGELSRRSGVPVATIKFYVREGLLPPGRQTAVNQALYDEAHLDRLGLVRALREAAGLPVATIARVLDAMDRHRVGDPPEHLTAAVRALSQPTEAELEPQEHEHAAREVSTLLDDMGWDVDQDSPGFDDLTHALVAVRHHLPGLVDDVRALTPYADAARQLARFEIPEQFDPSADRAEALRFSVLGTVLFEPVLLAFRKLAHVDRIRRLPRTDWTQTPRNPRPR